ncbi:MAG TPA: hypothetical protein VHG33_11790 [Woeseiaceae bacterium]|nr:hypothetical protein [Woeseiaceae bacterium]
MKLRIQNNSVRLRLTRGEVERMQREGQVNAAVTFPGGSRLEYALEASQADRSPAARFAAGRLLVSLPEADVQQWASSEQVSIEGAQPLSGGEQLAILVEKDFQCLTPREGEDEKDMFPHPLQDVESC